MEIYFVSRIFLLFGKLGLRLFSHKTLAKLLTAHWYKSKGEADFTALTLLCQELLDGDKCSYGMGALKHTRKGLLSGCAAILQPLPPSHH